jgi:hypothetical protein
MAKKAKAKKAKTSAKASRAPKARSGRAHTSKKAPRTAKASKAKKTTRKAKKTTARKTSRAASKRASASTGAKRGKTPAVQQARRAVKARTAAALPKKPNLDRERRTIREEEMVPSPPSSLNMDRTASAARTGRAEFEQRLRQHTSTGPAMTGGDVDADWEDAEAVGDEAPGGDNPTPDQDVVDEIGRAVGIEYDDDEELRGGDEVVERDRHRWELDPRSKDDFEEE